MASRCKRKMVSEKMNRRHYTIALISHQQRFSSCPESAPKQILRQDYYIALPQGSLLREPLNRVLLEKIREPAWQDILYRYLDE